VESLGPLKKPTRFDDVLVDHSVAASESDMAYSDFSLDQVKRLLGVTIRMLDLFPALTPLPVPEWLTEALKRGLELAFVSEKARSEFIVGPVLLTARDLSHDSFTIYSGQRLDVMPEKGLVGECDFILGASPTVPMLESPLVTIVEAKKNDIEAGLGQCVAQMVGARIFNERAGSDSGPIFGCVTTGETWQFLRLDDTVVGIDHTRYYINNVGLVLAVWMAVIAACPRGGSGLAA
jgi:hypothetical protein